MLKSFPPFSNLTFGCEILEMLLKNFRKKTPTDTTLDMVVTEQRTNFV